jgi:1,4-alpha-glucan branching enzyme
VLTEELSRVAKGLHPDPHACLGPHPLPEGGGWAVRVRAPGATRVEVLLDGGARLAAAPMAVPDVFEARLHDRPPTYRVEIETPAGTVCQRDPYAFGPTLGDIDLHLFGEGKHWKIHDRLGAHVRTHEGARGTSFAVWAPHALSVRVVGDFNAWDGSRTAMRRLSGGVWEIFLPDVGEGALYKFEIATRRGIIDKSDPFGRAMELRPQTASRVVTSRYAFSDAAWLEARRTKKLASSPMSIYEVHLPSWRRKPPRSPDDPGFLSYRELARELVDYVADLGFSHVELLPVMEHPYDGSWGYQVSGYFAPTSRLGSPDDFKLFVDRCHERGIGVLLDWVPAHFPRDASALGRFDGTPLFEHWDPRRGEHRQWETFVFDWGRPEVKNFLIASALYWLEEFHLDGLRVDAVASMLYLDYGASHPAEWEPNIHGGRENLEAVAFLRELSERVHEQVPGAILCAEESTAWPGVTRPTYTGGLGFDLKWNMGWMHDTLGYFALDPIHRSFHHNRITFSLWYAYTERFLLPLSHDEVVHLKRSLLGKMPGDFWQRRATLRLLLALMWAHPGRKLLFMGGELGQETEWDFSSSLPWELAGDPAHRGIQDLVRDLNAAYRSQQALHELDDEAAGFSWIDANDAAQSVLSFIRYPASRLRRRKTGAFVVCLANCTPVVRREYRVGVPRAGEYREILNTDAAAYGGGNIGNLGLVRSEPVASHGHAESIRLTLPPLAVVYLVPVDLGDATAEEIEQEEREALAADASELGGAPPVGDGGS